MAQMQSGSRMMLSADTSPQAEGQWADIYWGLLEPETKEHTGIQTLFQQWRPWIRMLHPYAPPADPFHVLMLGFVILGLSLVVVGSVVAFYLLTKKKREMTREQREDGKEVLVESGRVIKKVTV